MFKSAVVDGGDWSLERCHVALSDTSVIDQQSLDLVCCVVHVDMQPQGACFLPHGSMHLVV
jgi:hypothetical protein